MVSTARVCAALGGSGGFELACEAAMGVTASWAGIGGEWSVLVHGGAGNLAADRAEAHAEGCAAAVRAAEAVLSGGGAAIDAVQVAVETLEDDPRFNAGTGGSLNRAGRLELDASIMEGELLRAGAVGALPPHRNPIRVARAVLEEGAHVLYAGAGAAEFARRAGFEPTDASEMITDAAKKHLETVLTAGEAKSWAGGTVGAVARDSAGHVAAATSTGGTSGKHPGRVGDTPIIGAGTYADNARGAASATGYGEGILRVNLASAALAAVDSGESPERAARDGLKVMADRVGATGGLILVGANGELGWARSTATMSWAATWAGAPIDSGV